MLNYQIQDTIIKVWLIGSKDDQSESNPESETILELDLSYLDELSKIIHKVRSSNVTKP